MLDVHYWRVTILIFTVIAVGCSKEDLTGALDKAKNAVFKQFARNRETTNYRLSVSSALADSGIS